VKAEKYSFNKQALFVLFPLALIALILGATCLGYVNVSVMTVLKILVGKLFGHNLTRADINELQVTIVWDVRLPRILMAATVGGGLAISGAIFQGLLLNPLADPYTLGVSAGAAFGACVVLLFQISLLGVYTISMFAFLGGLGTLVFVMYLSSTAGGVSSNNLILSGVIVSAILSAGISFLKYLAQEKVSVMIFWLLGSFASSTWTEVGFTLSLVCVGTLVCLYFARELNLICLGNRIASSLGVNTTVLRLILLMTASLVAAVCVSVSGIIGFIGLLVPHMMRGILGPDHQMLIPLSFFCGALLLLGADTVTRALLPSEVPIGVLTALIGGPFFCYVFRKRQMGLS
jgi:iron complex transport system permease protein